MNPTSPERPIAAESSRARVGRVVQAALRDWGWLAAAGPVWLALGFGPSTEDRVRMFNGAGPTVVVVSAAIALALFLVALGATTPRLRLSRSGWLAAVVLACAMWIAAALVPAKMRVQADEYLISGTAMRLSVDGVPQFIGSGWIESNGQIHPATSLNDKRGLLVPLSIAATYRLLGHGVDRVFYVNLVYGLFATWLIYAVARRFVAPAIALSAALLLLSHPVFVWTARSGGMEPANLALLLLAAWCALRFADSHAPAAHLALVALGPVLAQARYESVLLGAALVLLGYWQLVRSRAGPWPRIAAAAIAGGFLPFAWQRAIPFEFGLELIDASAPFSAASLGVHLGHLLVAFSDPRYFGIGATALMVASVAAIGPAARGWTHLIRPIRVALFVVGGACSRE